MSSSTVRANICLSRAGEWVLHVSVPGCTTYQHHQDTTWSLLGGGGGFTLFCTFPRLLTEAVSPSSDWLWLRYRERERVYLPPRVCPLREGHTGQVSLISDTSTTSEWILQRNNPLLIKTKRPLTNTKLASLGVSAVVLHFVALCLIYVFI